jgi:hypothetical protein
MSEPTTDTRDPDLAKLKAEIDAAENYAERIEAQRRYDTYAEARRRYASVWDALTPQDRERVKVGLLPTGEPVITDALRAELRRRGLTCGIAQTRGPLAEYSAVRGREADGCREVSSHSHNPRTCDHPGRDVRGELSAMMRE